MKHQIAKLMSTAVVIVLAACTTTAPTIDTSAPPEQVSFDGLYPVKDARVDLAWARSDLDLSGYTKILPQDAGIRYRPVKSRGSEFPLDLKQKQRLHDAVAEAFRDEMEKSERFERATEPGPDVLILRAALLDVVSRVPPQTTGRGGIYLDSIGEATLLIELIDSQSNAVLVRALDRRAADQGIMMEVNSVTSWSQVSLLARSWARLLRTRLESVADNLGIGTSG